MNEEHYQELYRLKTLSTVPSVQKVLDDLINDRKQQQQQQQQQQQIIREPIKRSKAQTQTIYITTGYAWGQNTSSITLYITMKDANEISKGQYTLNVLERSLELDILEHKGANHKFKINQFYDRVDPETTTIKFKEDKIVIILKKLNQDIDWQDLRMKSTQRIYNELERYEKQYEPSNQDNFNTPFKEENTPSPPSCPHHPPTTSNKEN